MSGLTKVRDSTNEKNVYLTVDGSGQLSVKDSAVATALSGVSTAAKQATMVTSLAAIETAVEGTLVVNGSGVTQPVSAASLPLPSGASTSALQGTANTSLAAIDTKLGGTISVSSGISRSASTLKSSASISASDTTASIDMNSHSKLAIYGVSSDNSQQIVVQVSDDGSNWYDSKDSFYANGSNGHYHGVHEALTRYVRVKYSTTATETTKITKYV